MPHFFNFVNIKIIFEAECIMNIDYNKNEDHNKLLVSKLKQIEAKVGLGGGKSRIEKLHGQGKMTARERISYLID